MVSTGNKSLSDTVLRSLGRIIPSVNIDGIWGRFRASTLLIILVLGGIAWSQNAQTVDGYDRLNPEGLKQIDRISEALHQAGRISVIVGLALLAVVALKKLAPTRVLDSLREKRLMDAVEDIDGLLEQIRVHAETTNDESNGQTGDEGILAGMMEANGLAQGEDVPSYVLTVNDIMLDRMMRALTRLRRMRLPKAARYRNYMFTILNGIKAITEQCETTGAASSLAVNSRTYFANDRRYHLWKNLLGAYAKRGDHREDAKVFLIFMKNLRGSKALAVTPSSPEHARATAEARVEKAPEIPEILLEETLPDIQQAAVEEAQHLVDLVQAYRSTARLDAWQFELVRRQQQLHLRDDAKKILRIFLRHELEALQRLDKHKMLPCKTWDQILYMLGVKSTDQLHKRVEKQLLTGPEIIILEKAFLQTFAKREALQQLYGHESKAGVLIDLHVPEIQKETLSVLRQTHETEAQDLDQATEFLDEKETPQRHEVARLIKHFVHHSHLPHNLESKET
ncbi:MAG: hypothetical protein HQ515_14825 [Phycisphaeraceae bacterium]|nr:hypothetical protein [Phycisphaeraceae bacterium]